MNIQEQLALFRRYWLTDHEIAVMANVASVASIKKWSSGEHAPIPRYKARLDQGAELINFLVEKLGPDQPALIHRFMTQPIPKLGNRSPIALIRHEGIKCREELMQAAQRFVKRVLRAQ